MDNLEDRVRQLEIEQLGTIFKLSFLMEKFDVSSEIYYYLQGIISGKPLD
jgi:hypothetical protein